MPDRRTLLHQTADLAADYLDTLETRPVGASATHDELLAAFDGGLPGRGEAPGEIVSHLAQIAEPGLIASAGPRYFGFVIGGSLPSALAADWLTSAWDNNSGLYAIGPAASVAEEVAGRWLVELFGLPAGSSVGYTTGATMASFVDIAAGRHRTLERTGWNVEDDGLIGAPDLAVVVGAEAHVTIHVSLQMLGLGRSRVIRVETDDQGPMRADRLRDPKDQCGCGRVHHAAGGEFDVRAETRRGLHLRDIHLNRRIDGVRDDHVPHALLLAFGQ